MELFNVLATGVPVFGQTFDVSLNWIGQLIRWLCNGIGVVGVGIILFSLALKLITLPFDVIQRISMRKQNLQMKANQEKMEKLQKQYANDKDKYNEKVREMYAANGFSLVSSCLPMILSLVIFIVAIGGFNAYAQYSNVDNYNVMVRAYNEDVTPHCALLTEENYDELVTYTKHTNYAEVVNPDTGEKEQGEITGYYYTYTVKDDDKGLFIYYEVVMSADEHTQFEALTTKADKVLVLEKQAKTYFVEEQRAYDEDEAIKAYVDGYIQENPEATIEGEAGAVVLAIRDRAQSRALEAYETKVKEKNKFVWIKNIWVTDASYKSPVLNASDFTSEASREDFDVDGKDVDYKGMSAYTNVYTTEAYEEITKKLTAQKEASNGYFILIALSIGTILLQQFVTMRAQKEQQKYSSVDGMAGSSQKMTMIIMTGMFAIFSFMYSSAFSIYMITSNLFSMLSTLIINKFVDSKVEKAEVEQSVAKMTNHTMERIEKAKNAGKKSAEETKKNK